MNPLLFFFIATCSIAGYILFASYFATTYFGLRLVPGLWSKQEGPARPKRLMLIELPIALFGVTMTQLLMLSVAMGSEGWVNRLVAAVELLLALVWTIYLLAQFARARAPGARNR